MIYKINNHKHYIFLVVELCLIGILGPTETRCKELETKKEKKKNKTKIA